MTVPGIKPIYEPAGDHQNTPPNAISKLLLPGFIGRHKGAQRTTTTTHRTINKKPKSSVLSGDAEGPYVPQDLIKRDQIFGYSSWWIASSWVAQKQFLKHVVVQKT